jgi:hypothetical protein
LPRISEYTKIEDETEVHFTHFRYPLTAPPPVWESFMGTDDARGEAVYRTLVLIGRDLRRLSAELSKILEGKGKKGTLPPLWDGHAAERIAEVLHGGGRDRLSARTG